MATRAPGCCLADDARERAARVRLMLFDIDGVLTDGRLYYGPEGEALKVFHVHDGHGLKLLREAGIAVGVISGRSSAATERRLRDLGIVHAALGSADKPAALDALMRAAGVDANATGFMGDDWVDLAVMQRVGFAATVADAASGMQTHAHWCSTRAGGQGAARELAEFLLAAQGRLDAAFAAHLHQAVAQG